MDKDQNASFGIFGAFPAILNVIVECIWHTAEALEGREELTLGGGGSLWMEVVLFTELLARIVSGCKATPSR